MKERSFTVMVHVPKFLQNKELKSQNLPRLQQSAFRRRNVFTEGGRVGVRMHGHTWER